MLPLALFLTILAVLSWRWQDAHELMLWLAGSLSLLAIISSWLGTGVNPRWQAPALFGLAGVIALIKPLTPLWPCELACQGGDPWAQIGGIDIAFAAGVCLALLAILLALTTTGSTTRFNRLRSLAVIVSCCAAGISLSYIILLMNLNMLCGHCFAVHTAVLAGLASVCSHMPKQAQSYSPNWLDRSSWIIAGLCAMGWLQQAQQPTPAMSDPVELEPITPISFQAPNDFVHQSDTINPDQDRFLIAMDRGRRIGNPEAPWRMEVVLSLHCSHCAHAWPNLLRQLQEVIDQGRLQLVVRIRHQQQDLQQQEVASIIYTAAGVNQFQPWLMRGLQQQRENPALNPALQERDGIHDYTRMRFATAIERILNLDANWLHKNSLRSGPVPAAVLYRGDESTPRQRFQGQLSAYKILKVIQPVNIRQ